MAMELLEIHAFLGIGIAAILLLLGYKLQPKRIMLIVIGTALLFSLGAIMMEQGVTRYTGGTQTTSDTNYSVTDTNAYTTTQLTTTITTKDDALIAGLAAISLYCGLLGFVLVIIELLYTYDKR